MLLPQTPRTFGLQLYREHQDGVSVEDLSAALRMPRAWIAERIEAVRLCMEKQVRIELRPVPRTQCPARRRR